MGRRRRRRRKEPLRRKIGLVLGKIIYTGVVYSDTEGNALPSRLTGGGWGSGLVG